MNERDLPSPKQRFEQRNERPTKQTNTPSSEATIQESKAVMDLNRINKDSFFFTVLALSFKAFHR
jgi:hypothetical protein